MYIIFSEFPHKKESLLYKYSIYLSLQSILQKNLEKLKRVSMISPF